MIGRGLWINDLTLAFSWYNFVLAITFQCTVTTFKKLNWLKLYVPSTVKLIVTENFAQWGHSIRRWQGLCSVMYKFAPRRCDWVDGVFQQRLAWQQGRDRKKIYTGLLMMQKSCSYIINLLSPRAHFERMIIWGSFRQCLLFPSLNICHKVLTSTNTERRRIPNKLV